MVLPSQAVQYAGCCHPYATHLCSNWVVTPSILTHINVCDCAYPKAVRSFSQQLGSDTGTRYINITELLNLWTNCRPHCFPSPDSFTVNHSNWLLVFQHSRVRQRRWKQITREWKQKAASSSSLLEMHLRVLDRYGRIHQCCISMLEIRLWLRNYCAGVWSAITFNAVNRLMVMVWLLITTVIRLLAVNQSGRQLEIFSTLCTNTSSLMIEVKTGSPPFKTPWY